VVAYIEEETDNDYSAEAMTYLASIFSSSWDDTITESLQKALRNLLSRFWFNRVWILQKVFNARSVRMICGRYEVDWANIQLFRWWHRLGRRDIVHWPLVTTIKDRSIYFGKDLLHLLTEVRLCGATDERDKLYELFPMIRNATKDGLAANYTLSREETYLKYATYLSHQGPQFLCAVSHRPGGLHSSKLPT
jgi:hypothetical protein